MIIENSFEQGDQKWHDARIDSVGGTGLSKIITNKKLERSKSRDDYLLEKAGGIISREIEPTYQSWAIKWGHKYEPIAREVFEMTMGFKIDTCAMIFADEQRNWHVSPDGHRVKDGFGLEVKCPQLKEFRRTVAENDIPTKHILQCQSGLALTGWDYWWFMSFFPGLKPFIKKVYRDEEAIKIIKVEVKLFLRDLNELIEDSKNV